MSHQLTLTEIKVLDTLFPSIGLIFTITRLTLRIRSRRLWWDDALAFASALFTVAMSAATWIHYMDPAGFSKTTRIAAYYGVAEFFYAALWLARLSILYSILRLIPVSRMKLLLRGTSIAFVCIWIFLFAQMFWVCENQPNWKDKPQPQCALGLQVAICQLISDIASDFFLIAIPVRLFVKSRFEKSVKIRLVVIFGAASLTTIASLVHTAYILEGLGPQAIVSGIVEISVSLMVCNFVVVFPALWRSCGLHSAESSQERTFKLESIRFPPARSHTLTTLMDTTTALSAREPGLIEVSGIVHDGSKSPSFELSGRKGIVLYSSDDRAIDAPQKGRQQDHIQFDERNMTTPAHALLDAKDNV